MMITMPVRDITEDRRIVSIVVDMTDINNPMLIDIKGPMVECIVVMERIARLELDDG